MGPRVRSGKRRALIAGVVIGGGWATASFLGCVDLFHSTDFGGGASDAAAEGAVGDGGKKKDARSDGTTGTGDGASGADGSKGDAAKGDGGSHPGDAGKDAKGGMGDGGVDSGVDAGFDAGADFCSVLSSPALAQAAAVHACTWLGACAGTADLNEFGSCYPLALMAYDCNLNPNQQVRGPLHAYWDELRQAKTCDDVLKTVFAGQSVPCTNSAAACGSDLVDSGAFENVAVACADGGFTSAINCATSGYTCVQGGCELKNASTCEGSQTLGCDGPILHSCQPVENNPGASPSTINVDVGKDCTYFGAGACTTDGGVGGCVPNGTSTPCTPSAAATCADGGASVVGCPTGLRETLYCAGFGDQNVCSVVGGWFAPSNYLPLGCYNPNDNDYGTAAACTPSVFSDYAGPAGYVTIACADAGLGQPNCPDGVPNCKP